jgi:hypothetical protein
VVASDGGGNPPARGGERRGRERMEIWILYSARTSAEHLGLEAELDALRILRNDRAVANTAMSALSELAAGSDGHQSTSMARRLV